MRAACERRDRHAPRASRLRPARTGVHRERERGPEPQDAWTTRRRADEYDKTLTLRLGQQEARVSVLYDEQRVTLAAAFDSGINLLALLEINGGMPTRVSVARARLAEVRAKLAGLKP